MSVLTHMARWLRRRAPRGEGGFEITGMLIAIVIAVIAGAAGITLLIVQSNATSTQQSTANTMAELQDASTMLMRDVSDGARISEATDSTLTVEVVRDEICTSRAWAADGGELTLTTATFPSKRCTGDPVSQRAVVVRGLTSTPFEYYSDMSQGHALPLPLAVTEISRVTWDLTAVVAGTDIEKSIASGASFHAIGALDEGSGQMEVAKQPQLSLDWTTGVEGIDAPTLTWTDPTPGVTKSWTIYRIMAPEAGMGPEGDQTWRALITLSAGQLTHTDTTLEDGNRGQYVVRATTTDDQPGPASNQVVTGLRPAKTKTIAAGGRATSIELTWDQAIGANAYDLYRTESGSATLVLYKSWDELKAEGASLRGADGTGTVTYTDALTYGSTYRYAVVPINRWERLATTDSPSGQVATGAASTKQFKSRFARNISAYAQAYTAPAKPDVVATETTGSNWANTVTWKPADWTGYASATINGVHRNRGWESQVNSATGSSASGNWSAQWAETARGTTTKTATEPPWVRWRLLSLEARMESWRVSRLVVGRRRVGTARRRRPLRYGWCAPCGLSWARLRARSSVWLTSWDMGRSRCAPGSSRLTSTPARCRG